VVSVDVENTGQRPGDEIVQVYVTDVVTRQPGEQALKGFTRVHLAPGEKKAVRFELPWEAFQIVMPRAAAWSSRASSRSSSVLRHAIAIC